MSRNNGALRLFFAVWPDDINRSLLADNALNLAEATHGRAMVQENLHLTLIFLGEQPVEKLELIKSAASRVQTHGFDLVCDKIRYMEDQQLIWTGVSHPDPELSRLRHSLEHELQVAELSFDKRRFKPHVTLVRGTQQAPEAIDFVPCHWEVRRFSLVASNLHTHGPRYHTLQDWSLLPPKPKSSESIVRLSPNATL